MTPDRLIRQKEADWRLLEELIKKANSQLQTMTPEDARRLGELYRSASSDLALAQRDFPRHPITRYLNQTVARSHALIYRQEPLTGRKIMRYVTHTFPQTFRRSASFFWVAMLLFMIPGVLIGTLTFVDPDQARFALPANVQQMIPQIEDQELWTNIPVSDRPYASSFIMTNNIRVSFLAFAGGILAGLLTFYVMVFNGVVIGGILGLTYHYGIGFGLLTFMISHGVIELTVIFIAGAAGLRIGWAMLRPGLLSRRISVQRAAQEAVVLIIGCVPLLVIAGLIEGFISPAEGIPWPVKFGVGLTTGIILYTYLFRSGREDKNNFTVAKKLQGEKSV